MFKLMKRATCYWRTDPIFRKASVLKTKLIDNYDSLWKSRTVFAWNRSFTKYKVSKVLFSVHFSTTKRMTLKLVNYYSTFLPNLAIQF